MSAFNKPKVSTNICQITNALKRSRKDRAKRKHKQNNASTTETDNTDADPFVKNTIQTS